MNYNTITKVLTLCISMKVEMYHKTLKRNVKVDSMYVFIIFGEAINLIEWTLCTSSYSCHVIHMLGQKKLSKNI